MVEVLKKSGLREPFNSAKVKRAVMRSGASKETAQKVVDKVEAKIYDGITTHDIYDIAFRILDRERHSLASVYDLKRAIMRLGPAGYSFETYLGEILGEHGLSINLRQILKGGCGVHEIDVVWGEKKGDYTLVECKYHNTEGIYTGLKAALYTYARFLDLREGWEASKRGFCFTSVMLATNTKFSSASLEYSTCRGVRLLGWQYPKGAGINTLIDRKKLYPLTILRKVDSVSKGKFSDAGIMMVKDLLNNTPEQLAVKTNIPERKIRDFRNEARGLLSLQLN
ncbi:MAG: ATP cone domain-containing protein [Candidatus Altiarchaeota archaeon]|nr:ATP cone domain-containing protein [Candidatus Altiarchaeota archaeon]